jgi:hypothetical protein
MLSSTNPLTTVAAFAVAPWPVSLGVEALARAAALELSRAAGCLLDAFCALAAVARKDARRSMAGIDRGMEDPGSSLTML